MKAILSTVLFTPGFTNKQIRKTHIKVVFVLKVCIEFLQLLTLFNKACLKRRVCYITTKLTSNQILFYPMKYRNSSTSTLIKKKIKFSSFIRKFIRARLQSHILLKPSHIWLKICTFPHELGSTSSCMTLQPIPSVFPCI